MRIARSSTFITLGLLGLFSSAAACTNDVEIGDAVGATGTGGGATTGGGTTTGTGGGGPSPKVGKIDLLLDIDNSRSMADKQQLLAIVVGDITKALISPLCVDQNGLPTAVQPPLPTDPCPPGAEREHQPVTDFHIGVVSSSIGSAGADACIADASKPTVDDRAHLLSRTIAGGSVPTYANKGFLAWDPAAQLQPPGETDPLTLASNLKDMVLGVGQVGCGYEAQLESWYRFLADPEPYETIAIVDGKATPQGIDAVLLQQRTEFLRPDSLLVIVSLSDENDCSIRESGQFYFAAQIQNGAMPFHLPRARQECAANPNDPCCKSCGQPQGDCPADDTCALPIDPIDDQVNLRCWDQKRRFGIDFLYPVDRYTSALTQLNIANREGDLVQNPIFSDLDPTDAPTLVRDPSLVVMAGIVGVPWQDIARDPTDLAKGFKNGDELSDPNGQGMTGWDIILGDPASYVPPLDPHMVESYQPRSGVNPVTGTPIAPPGSPNGADPINGHEYSIPGRDDLQYACVFTLPEPRDCSPGSPDAASACDCYASDNDNPLCEPNPNDGGNPTLQARAKAYPGRRQLSVLKSIGDSAVVTSICPSQIDNPTAPDYAYRPAAAALLERVKKQLL